MKMVFKHVLYVYIFQLLETLPFGLLILIMRTMPLLLDVVNWHQMAPA